MHSSDYGGSFPFFLSLWCHWIWFFCYESVPHTCALASGVLSCYKPISSVIIQKLYMIPALFHFCQMPPYREKVKLFSPRIREFLFYLHSFEYELFSFNDFISFCWPKGERQRFGSRQLTPQKAEILRDTAQNSYIHMPYTDSFQFVLYTCCNFNGLLCLRIWRFPSLL